MHAVMLLAMGLVMLQWRLCRTREGRAPRAAIALLVISAAAVWVGSFGVVVTAIAGQKAGLLAACGAVWSKLFLGRVGVWQSIVLLAWVLALPARGVWVTARSITTSHGLLHGLRPLATGQAQVVGTAEGLLVPGLTTPAVTLGLLRPAVLIDAGFWYSATPIERAVVLVHEDAHRRGRHGLVGALVTVLTAGLAPLSGATEAAACSRRHLEALADDAAVRRLGAHTVGVTLGRVALGTIPGGGLGAVGNAVWRVRRLVAPVEHPSWPDRSFLSVNALILAVGLVDVAVDSARALSPLINPQFCPL